MGDPRRSKKLYSRPFRPYDKDRISGEKVLLNKYGLRRKNEIYKSEAFLRDLKRKARESIAAKDENAENKILNKAVNLGILNPDKASIDALLSLDTSALLERRLESLLVKLKMANTPFQARQFIVHGHVLVDGVKVTSPKYMVDIKSESLISFDPRSSLNSNFKHKDAIEAEAKKISAKKTEKPIKAEEPEAKKEEGVKNE